jgi:hypothetical protein
MKALIVALIVGLCASCTTITKVTEENCADLEGVRFFRPTPYLLVAHKDVIIDGIKQEKELSSGEKETTTQKFAVARKELECSLVYLPNPQEEYVIDSAHMTRLGFILKDGWMLTGMYGEKASALPQDLYVSQSREKNLKSTIGKLTGMMNLEPGLYQLVYENGKVSGLKQVKVIY